MTMDISKVPVEILFESARREIMSAVAKAQTSYAVPAYILRGYLFEAIAKVDDTHATEMTGAYGKLMDAMQKPDESEEKEEGDA